MPSVPDWRSKKIAIPGYATREPMHFFYRDALDCVEYLFGSPLFADKMDFSPVRLYRDAEQTIRVYSEWMTGDAAWDMQVCTTYALHHVLTYANRHTSLMGPHFSGLSSLRTRPTSLS